MDEGLIPVSFPALPGLYIARSEGYEWDNLIVLVEGRAPFLVATVWNVESDCVRKGLDLDSITNWRRVAGYVAWGSTDESEDRG